MGHSARTERAVDAGCYGPATLAGRNFIGCTSLARRGRKPTASVADLLRSLADSIRGTQEPCWRIPLHFIGGSPNRRASGPRALEEFLRRPM